jgi:thiamine biosynthesis lipoprotein
LEPAIALAGATVTDSWPALGMHVDLVVVGGDIARARQAVEAVLADVDRAYSRFRPDSELVAVNARAGETVVLGTLLSAAIDVALRAAEMTEGLCDPTVGRALRRIGYDRDFAAVVHSSEPIVLRLEAIPGWRTVQFDAAARTLRTAPGVELDLGSTGKAYAADLAAVAAYEATGRDGGVLVSLGGDLAIAGETPAGGWQVLMAEDSSQPTSTHGEVIALHRGAIATSSTTVRRWRRGGVEIHHLIDPRTGLPAKGPWRTASVVAGTCVEANAAATASVIAGAAGPAWLETRGLPGRFVGLDGEVARSSAWPVEVAERAS